VNLAIAAVVFPVIFLGELPNKTMIASAAWPPAGGVTGARQLDRLNGLKT
jgi:hypothetical protein